MTDKDKPKVEFCNCLADKLDIIHAATWAESAIEHDNEKLEKEFLDGKIDKSMYENIKRNNDMYKKRFLALYKRAENTPSCKMSTGGFYYNEPREDQAR